MYRFNVTCRTDYFFKGILLALGLCFSLGLVKNSALGRPSAATTADTLVLSLEKDLAQQLLPFESIYQLAVTHSPIIRVEDGAVENKLLAIQISRVAILSGISPTAAFNQGTANVLNIGQNANEFYSMNSGYRLGLNVGISMTELFGRRAKVQTAKAEYRTAMARRDQAKLLFKKDLNHAYQALLSSQKILRLIIRDAQAGVIVYRMAEVNYQKGKISAEDFAMASSTYTNLQITIEQKRSEFLTLLYDFEIMTGVELSRLTIN